MAANRGFDGAPAPSGAAPLAPRALLMRLLDVPAQACAYCAAAVPVGEVRCEACGAPLRPERAKGVGNPGESDGAARTSIVPLLLCILFPPAWFVALPILLWRWLRRADRGLVLPILICLVFPPAVILIVPALLLRPPGRV